MRDLRLKRWRWRSAESWRGTTKNWLWSTSEKETGPRAGMRWEPHWKMRPAFHATRRKMSAAAKARRGERESWANLWSKSARPKMKMGVNEMKKRLPKEAIPFQKG